MTISLKKFLTQTLLAIAIAAPTYVVASVSSAEAGGNHHKRYYKKNHTSGYAHRGVRRTVRQSARGSVRGSIRFRASSNYRYTTRTQLNSYGRVYVNNYRTAPAPVRYYSPSVRTQSHHHHYGPVHRHHYNQPHTRNCRY